MGFTNLLNAFARVPQIKTSRAGPMIAMHNIGQPKWTPRRMAKLAEEGFRKNTIAYRCVMQIATASAAVPWLLYDERGHEVDTHPLLDLLAHPNPTQDGVSFIESVYANLQISGNAYIEALRPYPDRPPTELYNLRPDRMSVIPGPTGLPQGYQYNVNGQVTTWPADPISGASNILHLKCFHPLDDWYGMAPMEAALLSIDQHNASGAWNQALLNQGARPSGALVYAPKDGGPSTLSDDQLQRLREEMGQLYQGDRNAGRPLILEGGLDWREMSLSPKDMDWLAGRSAAARDIALAFGVPAQLIGIPDAQTYANVEQARLAFYEETVLPLVTRVIAGVDHWIGPMYPDRPELDFDADEISALTDKRQAQFSKLQTANFLTRNEKREAAGYGPVPGGDVIDDGESSGAKYNHNHDPANGRFASGPGGDGGTTNGNNSQPATHKPAVTPISANADSDGYPTSSISNMSDAQQVVDNADGHIGKDDQCASLTHALAPDLPAASEWQPGDKVQGNTDIPVGTPVATFNFQDQDGTNGYGPPDHQGGVSGASHTGIYLGQDNTGMVILNQWGGSHSSDGPVITHIPWGAWGHNHLEGGSNYYTIDYN